MRCTHLFSRPWASRALHACKSMAWPNCLDIFLCRGACPQKYDRILLLQMGQQFPIHSVALLMGIRPPTGTRAPRCLLLQDNPGPPSKASEFLWYLASGWVGAFLQVQSWTLADALLPPRARYRDSLSRNGFWHGTGPSGPYFSPHSGVLLRTRMRSSQFALLHQAHSGHYFSSNPASRVSLNGGYTGPV